MPTGGDIVETFAFSPDSKTIAIGRPKAQIELWDWQNKKLLATLKYSGFLHAVAWSPDGKKIAAAGGAKIVLWDPQGNLIREFALKEGPEPKFPTVKLLAFGPDSKMLAAGRVRRIRCASSTSPSRIRPIRRNSGFAKATLTAIYSLAFSADGRTLLSGGFDRTVRAWEAFSGRQIGLYKGHVGPVTGIGFVKDGRCFLFKLDRHDDLRMERAAKCGQGEAAGGDADLSGPREGMGHAVERGNAEVRHEILWQCISSSKQSVPQLTKYLHTDDPDRIKKLFKDLDSSHYPTRIAAQNELAKKGRWMEGRYDAAIADPPSLEYKRRIEVLKEKLNAQDSPSIVRERLRVRRIMMLCEQVGSAEAIAALQRLADRGPEDCASP